MRNLVKIFLALILLFPLTGFSKDHKNFISITDQQISIKNFGFCIEKVINATGQSNFIGFVSKSNNGKAVPTYLENDISEEVHDFLQKNTEKTEGCIPLIIRVDALKISEVNRNGTEMAHVNVAITFFYKENGNYVRKFYSNIIKTRKAFFSVTKHQPELITYAIAQCFNDFYLRANDGKLEHVIYTEEELYHDPHNNNKIFNEYFGLNRKRKGIYKTFYDFRYATPDTSVNFVIEFKTYHDDLVEYAIKYALIYAKDTHERIYNAWGFCDGKNNYLNFRGRYYPLYQDNHSFFVYAKGQYTILPTHIGSDSKLLLNLLDGYMEFAGQGLFSTKVSERKETQVVFFSSRFNASWSKMAIYINGEHQCDINKREWFAYIFPSLDDSVQIDIMSSDGIPLSMKVYSKPYDTILLLCHDKKRKEPAVEKLTLKLKNEYEQLMTEKNRACPTNITRYP